MDETGLRQINAYGFYGCFLTDNPKITIFSIPSYKSCYNTKLITEPPPVMRCTCYKTYSLREYCNFELIFDYTKIGIMYYSDELINIHSINMNNLDKNTILVNNIAFNNEKSKKMVQKQAIKINKIKVSYKFMNKQEKAQKYRNKRVESESQKRQIKNQTKRR